MPSRRSRSMLDSKSLAGIPIAPANTSVVQVIPWPGAYTSAMFLSFDVDAESAWTGKEPAHAERLVAMSYGGDEGRGGTPHLFGVPAHLGLRATLFFSRSAV